MKLFVFDDHPWMAQQVESHVHSADKPFQVYALTEAFCRESHSIDEFFNGAWEGENWYEVNAADNAGMNSLKALSKDAPEDAVFIINVSLKSSSSSCLQDQDGVEVLKHIRLTEELGVLRKAHAVLYSVETPGALLWRKPGNLMMATEGVTLLYLPKDLKRLQGLNWLRRPKADLSPCYLTPFVACDYRQPDSAHMYSNWWGMQQFIEARRELANDKNIPMPSKVTEELLKLENKKARFLNKVRIGQVGGGMQKEAIVLPKGRIVHLDDEPGWQEIVKSALEDSSQGRIRVDTPPLYPEVKESGARNESNPEPSELLILPSGEINQKWLKKNLSLGNSKDEPNLVLLDLRMRGTKEANTLVEQTTGAQVARIIRELSPGLPIILMTASNKAWTFETAVKQGIDGYWMKEGIGEHLPPGTSIENYLKLLQLIHAALADEYRNLRRFSNFIVTLKSQKNPWWEADAWEWKPGHRTQGEHKYVFGKLRNIQMLYHEFLRATQMGRYLPPENIHTLFLGMCAEIRTVVEHIHGVDILRDELAWDKSAKDINVSCGLVIHNQTEPHKQRELAKITPDLLLRQIETYLTNSPRGLGGRVSSSPFASLKKLAKASATPPGKRHS